MREKFYSVEDFRMRELVILAVLVSTLHVASLHKKTYAMYKCQENQDRHAVLAAEQFINEHHRHGYKFRFVSLDSRTAEKMVRIYDSLFLCLFSEIQKSLLLVYEEYFNNIMKEKKKLFFHDVANPFCADGSL